MVLPVPNPGDTGHVAAHDTVAGILNDPATNWAAGNATYGAFANANAWADKQTLNGGTEAKERVLFGADLNVYRSTSFGFTQLLVDKPIRMSGFFLVDGDPNATGELHAQTGAGTNLAFVEDSVTSVSIRRAAGTAKLEFGQGTFSALTTLLTLDLSASTGAVISKVQGISGQTGDLAQWVTFGGAKALVDSSGAFKVDDGAGTAYRLLASGGGLYFQHNAELAFCDISSGTARFSIDTTGKPKWSNSANVQTTVGAAGGASALPATPVKYLRIKDNLDNVYVIPAYNYV